MHSLDLATQTAGDRRAAADAKVAKNQATWRHFREALQFEERLSTVRSRLSDGQSQRTRMRDARDRIITTSLSRGTPPDSA